MKSGAFASLAPALLLAGALAAQTATPAPPSKPAEPAGLTPDWDIAVVLREISAHAGRMAVSLDQLHPEQWDGAPESYVQQLNSAKAQSNAVAAETLALAKNPEKLSEALKVYFRMQWLQFVAPSLEAGARKYQNAATAQMVASAVAENGVNRDRFQKYIVDLAAQREQEFAVADHEAQRCRGMLAREPVNPPARKTGRK